MQLPSVENAGRACAAEVNCKCLAGNLIQGTLTSCRCTQDASQRLIKHGEKLFDKFPQQRQLAKARVSWMGRSSHTCFAAAN